MTTMNVERTNNHKQWSLILLYHLIHSENSLGKSWIIIFSAVNFGNCVVCASWTVVYIFAICYLPCSQMQDMEHWFARFYVFCVSVSVCVCVQIVCNAANDVSSTQKFSIIIVIFALGVALQTTQYQEFYCHSFFALHIFSRCVDFNWSIAVTCCAKHQFQNDIHIAYH